MNIHMKNMRWGQFVLKVVFLISIPIFTLLLSGCEKDSVSEENVTEQPTNVKLKSAIVTSGPKFLGNILRGTGVLPGAAYADPGFKDLWNQATPENNGKWRACEFYQNSYTWGPLDEHYNYCMANNIIWKEHALVWGQSIPDWLPSLSATQIKAEITEWIQAYFNRYPNTKFVDVVNEPINTPPPASVISALGGSTNYEWVVEVFRIAKQYKPANCTLILSEYNVLKTASTRTSFKTIIQRLVNEGLIGGIGCQAHFLEAVPAADLKSRIDELAAYGVPVYITEYDVSKSSDTDQLNVYTAQFPVMWEHASVAGITLWGYKQGETWKPNTHLVRTDGTDRPAFTWLKGYLAASLTNGNYKIENKSFNRRLKLSESTTDNVVTSTYNSTEPTITWTISVSGSYITAKNQSNGRYLKRSSGSTNAVTGCCIEDLTTWEFIDAGGGYYKLKNKSTGEYLDADSTDWNVKCNIDGSGDDKLWKFIKI